MTQTLNALLECKVEADLRAIEANDIPGWPNWSPADALHEFQWFTLSIGPRADSGAELFQVVVATPGAIRERRGHGKFVGLVVDRFEPMLVEAAIRDFVASCKAPTWPDVVDLLRTHMRWEYEGMRRQ